MTLILSLILLSFTGRKLVGGAVQQQSKPNIVFILADDLGWNDVGFHGSNQIPTPNIDTLAYTGVILNNYYVTPLCTPSRSALMTGKYPIHTGMQHGVIYGCDPWGLGLNETLMSEYLKSSGYTTRMVGKWHLGHFKRDYLPEARGFDSHYGYWLGHQDYYDHSAQEKESYWGYDMRRGMKTTWSDYGTYTTDLFTAEAVRIIREHTISDPLFLYVSHLAVHSGNSYNPLQAPLETVEKFSYIQDEKRRIYAGMLSKLDDSVGEIISALAEKGMLYNSIVIFSTDNGGPASGFNSNAASNWPLRGVKDTFWQGGVKGVGLIWSPFLPSGVVSNALMHITDWLPTLLYAVQANASLTSIDGVNLWESFTMNKPSPRKEILINIETERNVAGLIRKNWKLIKGHTWNGKWDGWYGPSGRDGKYDWKALRQCTALKSIQQIKPMPSKEKINLIRRQSNITCRSNTAKYEIKIEDDPSDTFLFDLNADPCEVHNLATSEPNQVRMMEKLLKEYIKTMVKPRNKPTDQRSNPKYWGYQWLNWMDYSQVSVI